MRNDNSGRDGELSRRRYGQILAGIGTAGLAGCPGSSDGTETATGDDGGGGGAGNSADETSTTTDGSPQPVTDTIRVGVNNTPSEFNANPWTAQDNTTGDRFLMELNGLNRVDSTEISLSGTTVPTPHKPDHDEVEIMTWIEEYSIEAPYDWRQSYDDRATFWNGDPYDAETLVTHNHVAWFRNGNKFVEGATFNEEAVDQWTRHGWFDKGDAPDQKKNPVSKPVLEDAATGLLFNPPMHPDFTKPYLRKFESAGTEEKASAVGSDLTSDSISLDRLAENGWGSGMYELRSPDDIGSGRAVLHLRDDDADTPHPNAKHTNVKRLEMLWAAEERRQTLQTNGQIDVDDGAITPKASPDAKPCRTTCRN